MKTCHPAARIVNMLAFALLAIQPAVSSATVFTFTGEGDGTTFTDAANWDANGVPPNTASDDWCITGGTPVISGAGNAYTNRWGAGTSYDLFHTPNLTLFLLDGASIKIPADTSGYYDFGAAGSTIITRGQGTLFDCANNAVRQDGAGQTLRISDSAVFTANRVFCGFSGASNAFEIVDGGMLLTRKGSSNRAGYGAGASFNFIRVGGKDPLTGAAALWDTALDSTHAADIRIGDSNETSCHNLLWVGADGVVSNANISVGPSGSYNSMVITNGGMVHAGANNSTANYVGGSASSFNTAWIGSTNPASNEKSAWLTRGAILLTGQSNSLFVANGGVISCGNTGFKLGYHDNATGNRAFIFDGGVVTNTGSGVIIVGENNTATDQGLVVESGGQIINTGSYAQIGPGSERNWVCVTNNGFWDNGAKEFHVGNTWDGSKGGRSNWVRVESGGVITNIGGRMAIGGYDGAHFNRMVVTNGGAAYIVAPRFSVGGWQSSSAVMTDGGNSNLLYMSKGFIRTRYHSGVGSRSVGNRIVLDGDAQWTTTGSASESRIWVGYNSGTNNALRVGGNALLSAPTVQVGLGDAPWRNKIVVGAGGTINTPTLVIAGHQALGALIKNGEYLNPTMVNGTITIGEDCVVEPELDGHPALGTYTLLNATLINGWENLSLSPDAVASKCFTLHANATTIRLTYKNPRTLFIMK